jgi:hypothetical protein
LGDSRGIGADRHKVDVDPESQDGIQLPRIQQESTIPASPARARGPQARAAGKIYCSLPLLGFASNYYTSTKTTIPLIWMQRAMRYTPLSLRPISKAFVNTPPLSWDLATKTVQTKPTDPDDLADRAKQVEFAGQLLAFSE